MRAITFEIDINIILNPLYNFAVVANNPFAPIAMISTLKLDTRPTNDKVIPNSSVETSFVNFDLTADDMNEAGHAGTVDR